MYYRAKQLKRINQFHCESTCKMSVSNTAIREHHHSITGNEQQNSACKNEREIILTVD